MWSSPTIASTEENQPSSLGIELQKLIEKTDSSDEGDDDEVLFPKTIELHAKSSVDNKSATTSRPYRGILLATLSAIFFSICSVVVKYLDDIDPIQLAAYR